MGGSLWRIERKPPQCLKKTKRKGRLGKAARRHQEREKYNDIKGKPSVGPPHQRAFRTTRHGVLEKIEKQSMAFGEVSDAKKTSTWVTVACSGKSTGKNQK